MRRYVALLAVLMLFAGGAACGEVHPLDEWLEACVDEAPSTAGMVDCAAEGSKLWDEELNRVYKELMGLLSKEAKEALRTAQRAWIPWRDSEYALIVAVYDTIFNSPYGGTMWVPVEAMAEMEVVRERTLRLTEWLEEMEAGKPSYSAKYPAAQTDEQLAAAMKVKNDSARLGKVIGKNGPDIASKNLKLWEDFRNKDAQFLVLFYGKKGDKGYPLHARMQMNVKRAEKLDGFYSTLKDELGDALEGKPKKKK